MFRSFWFYFNAIPVAFSILFFSINLTTGSASGYLVSKYVDSQIKDKGLVEVEKLSESYRNLEGKLGQRKEELIKELEKEYNENAFADVPESPDAYKLNLPEGDYNDEQKNQIEQDMAPFGFINDGMDDTSFVDEDGDRWFTDEYGDKGGGMDYMWNYR